MQRTHFHSAPIARATLLLLAMLFTLSLAARTAGGSDTTAAKPFVVPELKQWSSAGGTLALSGQARIIVGRGGEAAQQVAQELAGDLLTTTGCRHDVGTGRAQAGDIVLTIGGKDKQLGSEGYEMRVTDRVTLTAPTRQGLYWATRTLLQLIDGGQGQLARGTIRDWPDYAVRGAFLDGGRKFLPMSMLRQYVRIMAYYKMNMLHLHLNDNGFPQFFDGDWQKTYAAFRLECSTYPGLTARDGYYTKQEFIDLQKLADSLGVEIVPEIDVPAHSLAFTQYRPELASKDYGMDHLDIFNPKTYTFLDSLFAEYLGGKDPVFRGRYVHIGTDEYSNKTQALVEQFRAFTDHYIRLVQSYGKEAMVWGSQTHAVGKTPITVKGVLMDAWSKDYSRADSMMQLGYDIIAIPDRQMYIVPKAGYYWDYLDYHWLYDNWTPAVINAHRFAERSPKIRGGMFAVWNDIVGNGISTRDIHYRCMPAIRTLATKMWTGKNVSVSWDDFNRQAQAVREAPGVNYAGHYPQGTVLTRDEVKPGDTLPIDLIGWNYEVSFDIEPQPEALGTALFSYDDITFWLSDPISGKLGFSRDGYLNTFNYQFYPSVGDKSSEVQKADNTADNSQSSKSNSQSSMSKVQSSKSKVTIRGDREQTSLYINGQLVETLGVKKYSLGQRGGVNYIRTLVFPLHQAGQFNSHISNLKAVSK